MESARSSENPNRMVGINVPLPVPSSFHILEDGALLGDLNIYGPDGLGFYTQKTITQDGLILEI